LPEAASIPARLHQVFVGLHVPPLGEACAPPHTHPPCAPQSLRRPLRWPAPLLSPAMLCSHPILSHPFPPLPHRSC
jgi:hypothetical protein